MLSPSPRPIPRGILRGNAPRARWVPCACQRNFCQLSHSVLARCLFSVRSTRVDLWLLHTIAPGKDAVRTRGQSLGFDALNDGLHRPSMLRYMKKSFIEDRPATATRAKQTATRLFSRRGTGKRVASRETRQAGWALTCAAWYRLYPDLPRPHSVRRARRWHQPRR